jgi:hypothetical protein
VKHVDFDNSTVRVCATKTKASLAVLGGAGFLELERLWEMREQSKSDFIVEYAGKSAMTIRKSFNNACMKAGIAVEVRIYDLSHHHA